MSTSNRLRNKVDRGLRPARSFHTAPGGSAMSSERSRPFGPAGSAHALDEPRPGLVPSPPGSPGSITAFAGSLEARKRSVPGTEGGRTAGRSGGPSTGGGGRPLDAEIRREGRRLRRGGSHHRGSASRARVSVAPDTEAARPSRRPTGRTPEGSGPSSSLRLPWERFRVLGTPAEDDDLSLELGDLARGDRGHRSPEFDRLVAGGSLVFLIPRRRGGNVPLSPGRSAPLPRAFRTARRLDPREPLGRGCPRNRCRR